MKIIAKFNNVLIDEDTGEVIVSFKTNNFLSKARFKEMDKDTAYSIDFKPVKDKRTILQNRLMWELCKELAMAINFDTDMEMIYCNAIERFSPVFLVVHAPLDAKENLALQFRAVTMINTIEVNNQKLGVYKCFIGSSNFNKEEMGMLIDGLLYMSQEAGIDWHYWKEAFDVK